MESSSSVDRIAKDYSSIEDEGLGKEIFDSKSDDLDESSHLGTNAKKPRIVYNKDFLLECFFLPRSRQKPVDFPLPNLGCTLGSIKVGNSPFTVPPPYLPPKRKEELGRREREREPDDNISLRPHSGNFSGGCGPILSTHGSKEKELATAGLQQIIDEHFRRGDNGRNSNHRFSTPKRIEFERSRGERERENRDTRDRDRDARDRDSRGHRDRETRDIRDRDTRDIRDRDTRDRDIRDRDFRDIRDRDREREVRDTRDRDRDREVRDTRIDRERDYNSPRDRERDNRDTRGDRDSNRFRDRDNRYTRHSNDLDRDMRRDRERNGRGNRNEERQFNHERVDPWDEAQPEALSQWNQDLKKKGAKYDMHPFSTQSFNRKDEIQRECTREYRRHHEAEPEWFSGGPSSQHETIELRGFMDDERREKVESKDFSGAGNGSQHNDAANGSSSMVSTTSKETQETVKDGANEMNLSFEKIFSMEHIPGILPNGLLEDEEPSGIGMSKFSQIFQRNSATTISASKEGSKGKNLHDKFRDTQSATSNSENLIEEKETEGKKEIVEELTNALRNILLNPNKTKTGNLVEKKLAELPVTTKKAQPQNKTENPGTGVNMLQALLDKMIDPVGPPSGRSSTFTPTSVMRKMTGDSPKPSSSGNLRGSPCPASTESSSADFSMIVQQLNSQTPIHYPPPPLPMNYYSQFRPIHPHPQMMTLVRSGPGMMMHPNFGVAPPQSLMNISHVHHEMPQSFSVPPPNMNMIRFIPPPANPPVNFEGVKHSNGTPSYRLSQ